MNSLIEFQEDLKNIGGLWYEPYVISKLEGGFKPDGVIEPLRMSDFLSNSLGVRKALRNLLKEILQNDTDEDLGLYVKEVGHEGRVLPVFLGRGSVNVGYPVEVSGDIIEGRYNKKSITDVMKNIRLWIGSSPLMADFMKMFDQEERKWKSSYVAHEKAFGVTNESVKKFEPSVVDIDEGIDSYGGEACRDILLQAIKRGFDVKIEKYCYANSGGRASYELRFDCDFVSEANTFINWMSGRGYNRFIQMGKVLRINGFTKAEIKRACDMEHLDIPWV